jgi:hypothetical protein
MSKERFLPFKSSILNFYTAVRERNTLMKINLDEDQFCNSGQPSTYAGCLLCYHVIERTAEFGG